MISGSTWLHAPTLRIGIATPTFPPPPDKLNSCLSVMAAPHSVRIAVVGDVPDLVLFTGDFGNENVDLVRSIANLDIAKAVILGNHDAWRTEKFSAREKDNVQIQLECLNRYGVHDMDGSAKRIYDAASRTPEDHITIFLAHNGPTGLGSKMNDICGKDWVYGGGDHGDPDLARAISQLKETTNISIPLVVFGHMHKQLQLRNEVRKMIVVGDDDTVYLNGAIVPRVRRLGNEQHTYNQKSISDEAPVTMLEGTLRAFTIVEIVDRRLEKVAETWVSVIGENISLAKEQIMFKRESSEH